ncbi:LPXTG-motif cell wall-anchored protein [Kibdelosporangium banguiense]|uniref:LPXTG-motif cell wall-anchored protein n=1 Tax=Kibdelosporangium banguiense TaxID=1365924 RepID=A0ABS4TCK6_9PSEU|nr:LPXTG cell wall anchor domain-containing protein [Kibdelosporangium banguiense]MBP2321578.1 LPXTG-motif cell wall-anchored protein [Kibdelosporangium banguiense]
MTGGRRAHLAAFAVAITLGLTGTAGPAIAKPLTAMNAPTLTQSDVSATPGRSSQDAPVPLEVEVAFDKSGYRTGELIKAVVTLKNVGNTGMMLNGSLIPEDPGSLIPLDTSAQWGDLQGAGVPLEPGATHTVNLSGYPKSAQATRVRVHAVVFVEANGNGKQFVAEAPVTLIRGDASGVVYGDMDGDGGFDAGEELPGVKLVWEYASNPEEQYTATSNGAGVFTFPDLPTTRYRTVDAEVNGWKLLSGTVEIGPQGAVGLRIRGVRNLTGVLKPELKFTKDTYQPGELAQVTVSLTNAGEYPLSGIVANCNRGGAEGGLPTGPGWGDLDTLAKGVTLPPGRTTTFDVTSTVPQGAYRIGAVSAWCDFAYQGYMSSDNLPTANDTALVPGGRGGLQVTVRNNPTGDVETEHPGLPGVKVIVVDDRACKVAEKTTDQQGVAEITGLAAGAAKYSLYYYPPSGSMMKSENPQTMVDVWADSVLQTGAQAAPGAGEVPGLPAPSPECGQPRPSPPRNSIVVPFGPPDEQLAGAGAQGKVVELAKTGADDVLGLSITGMTLLLLGTGAVVATRRRRDPTGSDR